MKKNRREFIQDSAQLALGLSLFGLASSCGGQNRATGEDMEAVADSTAAAAAVVIPDNLFFKISLAEWSLNKSLFGGKLDNLDFAAKARNDFGIDGVEYVNQFFKDKATDQSYLTEMKKRADDNGVRSLLIMVDGEGGLGDTDAAARKKAVENHHKWVDAAKFLGCHSIRVNAYGEGTAEEVQKAAAESLAALGEYAAPQGINVIVENHGGYSSDGEWLVSVMRMVGMANVGTLPDFGNFCVKRSGPNMYEGECVEMYDRYKGVQEMMEFAKAVSAKSHNFGPDGNETETDYLKMMQIVKDAGYNGYVGIEYEGDQLPEDEGIRKTRDLLIRVGKELSM